MQNQQYQQIINFITFSEVRKLKDLKKNKELFEKMVEIPNCYFQIHWKTCKGILTFKQLPKDIITIFKKDGFLRIDYNVDDLEKPSPNGHYSILIKTYKNKKMEFYLINNNKKKIVDLMKEI